MPTASLPIRKPPPPFAVVTTVARQDLTPRMVRLTLRGDGLRELGPSDPAASIRLVVPSSPASDLVIPTWNGNEFLLPDGTRPALRTFTPLRIDREAGQLDVEIVNHPGGAVSRWAAQAQVGSEAAISGPGNGYEIESDVAMFVLLGDETAIPAMGELLSVLPAVPIEIHIEVESAEARLNFDAPPHAAVTWHVRGEGERPGFALVKVAQTFENFDETSRLWAAGEAAAMQAIRNHLFKELGLPRSVATVRGYWKVPRG